MNPYDLCIANKTAMVEGDELQKDECGRMIPKMDKDRLVMKNMSGRIVFQKVLVEKQITVVWYIDDLMVSYENNFEITKFACYLAKIYGLKLTKHTRRKHDYLGIDFEFTDDEKVEISMFDSTNSIINNFPEKITSKSVTPAADHLFKIRDELEAKLLSKEKLKVFSLIYSQITICLG